VSPLGLFFIVDEDETQVPKQRSPILKTQLQPFRIPGMKEVPENVHPDYENATAVQYPTMEQPENMEMSSGRLNSGTY